MIDIKPYHYLDSLSKEELEGSIYPQWLLESKEKGRLKVTFSDIAKEELQYIVEAGSLDFYSDLEEVKSVIREVFELNPHSVHTLNKHKEGIYAVALDNMNIVYTMDSEKTEITVKKVIYVDNSSL